MSVVPDGGVRPATAFASHAVTPSAARRLRHGSPASAVRWHAAAGAQAAERQAVPCEPECVR